MGWTALFRPIFALLKQKVLDHPAALQLSAGQEEKTADDGGAGKGRVGPTPSGGIPLGLDNALDVGYLLHSVWCRVLFLPVQFIVS